MGIQVPFQNQSIHARFQCLTPNLCVSWSSSCDSVPPTFIFLMAHAYWSSGTYSAHLLLLIEGNVELDHGQPIQLHVSITCPLFSGSFKTVSLLFHRVESLAGPWWSNSFPDFESNTPDYFIGNGLLNF